MPSYYLLENKVRTPPTKWYTSRRSKVQGVVIHVTAGLEDLDQNDDQSAEATARYCANTDRAVSWHAGADSDSYLHLLPASYTAFHVQGFNSSTLGLELSKKTTDWRGMDPEWVRKTLTNGSIPVKEWCAAYGIPPVKRSRAQWDAGHRGFISHAELDPSRRSDPGLVGVQRVDTFPWQQFLALVAGPHPQPEPPPPPPQEDDEMLILFDESDGSIWLVSGGKRVHIPHSKDVDALRAAGVPIVGVTHDFVVKFPVSA